MTFEPAQPETPTAIGDISHVITDYADGSKTMSYSIQILDQNGAVMDVKAGDEQPHLTQAQIDGLLAFAASQRAKAVAEILGG